MRQVVLDAGALIALEPGTPAVRAYALLADKGLVTLHTSSGVVARVWRGGARQARLGRLLASDLLVEQPLDPETARRIGTLAGASGARDVVDGHVALLALDLDAVVQTGAPDDIADWGVPRDRLAGV